MSERDRDDVVYRLQVALERNRTLEAQRQALRDAYEAGEDSADVRWHDAVDAMVAARLAEAVGTALAAQCWRCRSCPCGGRP